MQEQNQIKKDPDALKVSKQKVKPFKEDFRKIKSDSAIGIMRHSDGTVETRKF